MTEDLLHSRVNEAFAATKRSMDHALYAGGTPAKLSRARRLMNWLTVRSERIKDAWLVLTGKASIGC